jgi:tetratricopeptide repeat protein
MRRSLACWVLVCLGLVLRAELSLAELANPGDAWPRSMETRHMTMRNFVPYRVTHSVQAPTQLVADNSRDRDRGPSGQTHDHAHHADYSGGYGHRSYGGWSNPGFFLGGGYPIIWGAGYTPAFSPVYPATIGWLPNIEHVAPLPQPAPAPSAVEASPKGAPKNTSPEQKARAGKFIGFGDANFAEQKYLAAIERYKSASRIAPDLAEPYLRQGHALVALGQYENAVKAFRRGLRIRPEWSGSPFRLDQLYGPDRIAKVSHIEALAKAVEANPLDSNLLMALGVQLFFDGQAERASVFFARVAQLGGNDDRLLNDFLPKPAPAGAPPQEKPAPPQGPAKIVF